MKAWIAGCMMVLATGLSPTPVLAADASRLLGRWSVDVSQLPMPEAARPRRVLFSFDDAGKGQWHVRVEIVQADGVARISDATVAMDGTTAPIEGDRLEADSIAARQPVPDQLVLALGKAGVPASTRVYGVQADGDHMVETAVHFGADGKAVMRTFHFDRVD